MSYNNHLHELGDLDAARAPLAYHVEYDWGGISVTANAADEYGIEPLDPGLANRDYPTYWSVALNQQTTPPPNIQVLVASPGEVPVKYRPLSGETGPSLAVLGPNALHVIVSAYGGINLQRENGRTESDLALLDDPETDLEQMLASIPASRNTLELDPDYSDRQPLTAIVDQLATASSRLTTDMLPAWQHNYYDACTWRLVQQRAAQLAGGMILVGAGQLWAPELPIAQYGFAGLCAASGIAAVLRARDYLHNAQGRIVHFNREASVYGHAVNDDLRGLFLVPEDDGEFEEPEEEL